MLVGACVGERGSRMQGDHVGVIEKWNELRAVQVKPVKTVGAQILIEVAHILRIIPATAGGTGTVVPPVEFHFSASAPEVGLMVDPGSGFRSELLLGRDVPVRMAWAYVDRQVRADQVGSQTLADANA